MIFTLLGTGTSHGIPQIACDCAVCTSTDICDRRTRCSALIQANAGSPGAKNILIDCAPDFHEQARHARITSIDALLLTHSHADHLHGLDDLRVFSHKFKASGGLPLYSNRKTLDDVKSRFSYVFKSTQQGGGKPNLRLIPCETFTYDNPLRIDGTNIEIVYIPIKHGEIICAGWVITETKRIVYSKTSWDFAHSLDSHSVAYLTDCNFISDESIKKIKKAATNLDYVIIDALRQRDHSTHFNFDQALECALKIGGKKTLFTHICHDTSHKDIAVWLSKKDTPPDMSFAPAYDGWTVTL
ncbi:MAG: GPMC system MBL fold metallohydrolase [Treponemataceae bacterium]|nr:MAG: GPMC system MBL fold metallohydrolase [Treponemataceae bacterium]